MKNRVSGDCHSSSFHSPSFYLLDFPFLSLRQTVPTATASTCGCLCHAEGSSARGPPQEWVRGRSYWKPKDQEWQLLWDFSGSEHPPLHPWLLSCTGRSGSLGPSFSLGVSAQSREITAGQACRQEPRQVENRAAGGWGLGVRWAPSSQPGPRDTTPHDRVQTFTSQDHTHLLFSQPREVRTVRAAPILPVKTLGLDGGAQG